MKIFVLCLVIAVTCAYPTDTKSDDKSPAVPSAYAHKPLADQQGPAAAKTDSAKPKRDTSTSDTKKYSNNDDAPFVRPVPVSEILGKANTDDATKKTPETVAPVDTKNPTKRDVPKAQTLPAKVGDDTKGPVPTDNKKPEETKNDNQRNRRDSPKSTADTTKPAPKEPVSDLKKPEETKPRATRDAPKSQLPVAPTSAPVATNNDRKKPEDVKISSQPRTRRDAPKSDQPSAPTGNVQLPKTQETQDKKEDVKPRTRRDNPKSSLDQTSVRPASPYNPTKAPTDDVKVDATRKVRDIPKDFFKVDGSTPPPSVDKVVAKNSQGQTIVAEKLN